MLLISESQNIKKNIMKNLSIAISNDDYKKIGLTKETFSFGEFLSIIENEIAAQTATMVAEPVEKYGSASSLSNKISLQVRKLTLKQRIDQITTEVALRRLEKFLNEITLSKPASAGIFKPIKKDISVKQMIKAQKYHGIDADILDKITHELNIQEPLDELLKSV